MPRWGETVAMLLVLLDAPGEPAFVDPPRLHRLSELGVTDLAILRGDELTAVLLQGWALDPAAAATPAGEIVAGPRGGHVLLPILQACLPPPVPAFPPATSSAPASSAAPTRRSRT